MLQSCQDAVGGNVYVHVDYYMYIRNQSRISFILPEHTIFKPRLGGWGPQTPRDDGQSIDTLAKAKPIMYMYGLLQALTGHDM